MWKSEAKASLSADVNMVERSRIAALLRSGARRRRWYSWSACTLASPMSAAGTTPACGRSCELSGEALMCGLSGVIFLRLARPLAACRCEHVVSTAQHST